MSDTGDPRVPSGTAVLTVDGATLRRVGARPGLARYLASLWEYRSFILFDSRSRIAGANSVNALGRVWMVLNPILDGAAYFLVFGLLLGTGRGVPNFLGYLIIGVFLFRYTSSAITAGSRSISTNLSIVRAFRFPRATLPIATNIRELMLFGPTLVVMLVLVLAIPPMEQITWRWLLLIPLLALQTLFNVGASLLLARYVARWSDLSNLIAFGTRIWLYVSAVFFSADRFANIPPLMTAMHLNPLFCVLDIARQSLLYASDADPMRWIVLAAWTAVLLVVGTVVFWRAEETYGEER
ncbi:ABC transporter permease [Micrococcus luteus]|uniref:ABC transporter permease n=1 Tax=Micrococcus luteus TaxID=1270 RepID=UPI00044CDB14|nr:ABC transporter permease [Micrococcus luteus]EZP32793.1 ABC-2 type transporter [Micrococcus luteus]MCV7528370.1 ABC transporter permease [Micrococcus luteus]MCV7569310.1 ABC transporter permease [Micrococcus luteus]MCV7738252.1 ABC transporter permease [Micrococcus luteus]VWX48471.1 Transport permease protein [Micrococcus luteus]